MNRESPNSGIPNSGIPKPESQLETKTKLKLKTIFWPPKIVSVLIPQIKTTAQPVSSPLSPFSSDNIPKDYSLEC